MHFSKTQLAVIALIIANIIWGAASPIFKWSLENIQPFTLAFLRFFIASFLILPFVYKKLYIPKADFIPFVLISLTGITINIALFFLGLKLSASINAPIIASAGPVFLIVGSVIFLKEKIKQKMILGTIISLIGVGLIVLQPVLKEGLDGSLLGNVFFVIATISTVIHTILLKKLSIKHDPLVLTFWSFFIGSLFFLPIMHYEIQTFGFLTDLNYQGVIGILYGIVFSSAIAYALFAYSLKYLVASEVGIFVYMDPIIAILIAIPLLGETLNSIFVIGSALVFLGIFIAEGRLHYHPFHKLRDK